MIGLKRIVVAVLWAGLAVPGSAPAAPSGGAYASEPATIRSISCVAACEGVGAATAGSVLRVRGSAMSDVAKIVFLGGRGDGDDVVARVLEARRTSVDVTVPRHAASGRLRALNGDGAHSRVSRAVISVTRGAGGSGPLDVKVIGRRVFYDAARQARVDLLARQPMTVDVTVVRVIDGATVIGWPLALAPGVVSSVRWDGRVAGVAQPPGRYEFRVAPSVPTSAAVAASAPGERAAGTFDLVDHIFPVRGRHDLGEGQAVFGAGRNGHTHQGQDVFAACGTAMVAARGGVVKINQSHSAAGNYVVIDGEGTDVDYAYMHLRDRSPLAKNARVRTGQLIGHVGDTGDARGCHLHFEMWSGPGWYTGGAPFDPLPFLLAWDAYS